MKRYLPAGNKHARQSLQFPTGTSDYDTQEPLQRDGMKNDLRIVLLEDLPSDAELIEHEIRKTGLSFVLHRTETREEYLRSLMEFSPDVILSGYRLPGFSGIEALELAREYAATTPFLIVTGSLSGETAVECMKAGAWDYLNKDRLYRIGPAIAAVLQKKRALDLKEKAELLWSGPGTFI